MADKNFSGMFLLNGLIVPIGYMLIAIVFKFLSSQGYFEKKYISSISIIVDFGIIGLIILTISILSGMIISVRHRYKSMVMEDIHIYIKGALSIVCGLSALIFVIYFLFFDNITIIFLGYVCNILLTLLFYLDIKKQIKKIEKV